MLDQTTFRSWRKCIYSTKWLSAAGGSVFARPNGFPLLAEVHLLDQTAFRSWRKCIYSTKWLSAVGGSVFARPNSFPQPAEMHLLDQMRFDQIYLLYYRWKIGNVSPFLDGCYHPHKKSTAVYGLRCFLMLSAKVYLKL